MTRPLAVLAFSGGMDSTTLAAHYHATGHALLLLSFNYGQRHTRELEAARAIADHYRADHHTIDLTTLAPLLPGSALTDPTVPVPDGHYAADTMKSTVVPNRNAIIANVCAAVAAAHHADVMALGIHAGDHAIYPDCRPEFLSAVRAAIHTGLDGHNPPGVEAPFVDLTKTDIARRATELAAPIELSWSCYKGGVIHCGTCGTCTERREAFRNAGLTDPTTYEEVTA